MVNTLTILHGLFIYNLKMKGYFFAVNPGNREEELHCYKGVRGLTAAVATHDKLIFGSSGYVFITCLNPENGEVKWRTYTGGKLLESIPAIKHMYSIRTDIFMLLNK